MASAKLYLDTRSRKKDGTFPLKITITHKGVFQINLGIDLKEDEWEDGKVIGNKRAKVFNLSIQSRFVYVQNQLLQLGNAKLKGLSNKELKALLDGHNEDESDYLFRDHLEKIISEKKNPRTREVYQYTYDKVKAFSDIDTLKFDDINYAWLKNFDTFISDTSGTNARAIHLRNIRSVFNDAIDEDLVSQNVYPFRRFKIKTEKTIKRSLTVDELRLLKDFECEEYLIKYRDLFMLIFYLIGINIIDLLNLKEIRNEKIEYRRAKTGRLYDIRVQPEALEIINKYKGKNYLLDILDVYTNYKDFTHRFNMNLKRIGSVEIGKKGKKEINPLFPDLTSYYARHTWATIAASLDIPKKLLLLH